MRLSGFRVRTLMVAVAVAAATAAIAAQLKRRSERFEQLAAHHDTLRQALFSLENPFYCDGLPTRAEVFHGLMIRTYKRAASHPWEPLPPLPVLDPSTASVRVRLEENFPAPPARDVRAWFELVTADFTYDDPRLSSDECRMVRAAVRAALDETEQQRGFHLNFRYSVQRTPDGWRVLMVRAFRKSGSPYDSYFGGRTVVDLDRDSRVTRIVSGV